VTWIFNLAVGKVFALLFWPLRTLGDWPAMIIIAFLTGLLMLFIFRFTSNQAGIRSSKNRIKAHLLELRLYKDNLAQQLRSQSKILAANGRYIGYAVVPMLVMVVPVVLILIQLGLWYESRPLRVGESALLKIKLAEGGRPLETEFRLEAPPGIEVETQALRIEDEGEVDWRLKARDEGVHVLVIQAGGERVTMPVTAGPGRLARIAAVKPGPGFFGQLFNPGDKPIPKSAGIASVEVAYPPRTMSLFGWRIHWLIAYFVLSVAIGFAFKGVFKVEI